MPFVRDVCVVASPDKKELLFNPHQCLLCKKSREREDNKPNKRSGRNLHQNWMDVAWFGANGEAVSLYCIFL